MLVALLSSVAQQYIMQKAENGKVRERLGARRRRAAPLGHLNWANR